MKIYKVTAQVWVKGNNKQEAVDNLVGDMDYLLEMENEYVNVVAFEHPEGAWFDKEATQRFKGEDE